MRVNVYAMAQLCQAFAPGMRDRGYGRIVNLTSGVGDDPPLTVYATSKSGVDRITRCFANELRGTGVLVNALDPGWLKTDMGGPNAPGEVETVLPGAILPALLPDDGPTGYRFQAQTHLTLADIK
jgi:NAD(P)-dependent dehydrogenase (short-subunit alcohol dehydrogenase family)